MRKFGCPCGEMVFWGGMMRLHVERKVKGAPGDRFFLAWGEKVLRRIKGPSFVKNAEVSLVLCGDATIHKLNKRWRGHDKPTDVLSFPQLEGEKVPQPKGAPLGLGDVVISLPTAKRQAKESDKALAEELALLWVHGLLHLLGYDHATQAEEKRMFGLQERILGPQGRV
jgi:probable rRNA maturation factor